MPDRTPVTPQRTAPCVIADIARLPWRPIVPGLYSRSLQVDDATGARVALIRMVPEEGYRAPDVAHYHETYEEIVGLKGRFTFDSQTWLGKASYVLHPSGTVHGFASQVLVDSIFLSRVGPGHKAMAVPDPKHRTMYAVDGYVAGRDGVALSAPISALGAVNAPLMCGNEARWHVLSEAVDGVGGAAFVVVPAGWSAPGGTVDLELQIFVVEGSLDVGGEPVGGPEGGFVSAPAGARWPALAAPRECILFVAQGIPETIA